jgi:hypothetical protein
MIYSAYSNIVNATTLSVGEVAIRLGNTVGWYASDDLTTITKDGANAVSRWNDKLLSGRDLIQATGTNQPLWSADGVLFDGSDNFMKTTAFTWNQPEFIYMVVKQITWVDTESIFDGNTLHSGVFQQRTLTPGLKVYADSFSDINSNLTLDTWGIVRVLFNHDVAGGSKLQVNNTIPITGDFGISNMGGFILGCKANIASWANIQVKEIILRNVADSVPNETSIYNYLATKYGFATI